MQISKHMSRGGAGKKPASASRAVPQRRPHHNRLAHIGDRDVARQNAKRWRIIRKGFAPSDSKAELRALADQAAASHAITRLP